MNAPHEIKVDDDPITEAMMKTLQAQRDDYIAEGFVTAETRIDRMRRGMEAVHKYQDKLTDALNTDFSCRPKELSMLTDIAASIQPMKSGIKHVRKWMKPEKRKTQFPMNLMGGRSHIEYQPLGVVGVISPWNFPLAIFTGQIAAALMAGNAVLAKPAEQTGLMAAAAVKLMHRAGVPGDVLHLLPGDGAEIGGRLVKDGRVGGVAFTGSVETGQAINRALAAREGPMVPLIAETGGQNAMIVDSTALPEQVVKDVVISGFQSAGQRCSALRVLYLQEEIAERTLKMLSGAMAELRVGDPAHLATDVGPVIDEEARDMLAGHDKAMTTAGRLVARSPLGPQTAHGCFVAPACFEIESLGRLQRENFGPIVHVVRYRASRLDKVVEAINESRYGLTLGIHSRIDSTADFILRRAKVGNAYVNRNMIGAIVGVQPFGGEGLSGTGPKAGGPNYLKRFAVERVVSIDTTAAGGNASLMSLGEEELPM